MNVRRLVLVPLLVFVGATLFAYNRTLHTIALRNHGNDFGKFYYATESWLDGGSLYAPTIATHMQVGPDEWQEFTDLNPPFFHLIVIPFTRLSLSSAANSWVALNVAVAAVAMFLVFLELQIRLNLERGLFAAVCILACAATGATAITGQFTGLLLLAFTLAWRWLRQGALVAAGVALGTLLSVKPFLAPVLALLVLRKERRTVTYALAALVGWGILSLAVFGWRSHLEWFGNLQSVNWFWQPMNASIEALLVRAFEVTPYYTPIVSRPLFASPLWLAASIAVVVLSVRPAVRSQDHALAIGVVTSLLISPLGWIYYAWLAFPPCAALWLTSRPLAANLAIALLAVPLPLILAGQAGALASTTLGSCYTYAIFALWVGLVMTDRTDGN